MHRNSDGNIVISKTVLGTIASVCLAAGSGGTWFAKSASAQDQAAIAAKVEEHRLVDEGRDAAAAAQIQALKDQLNRMEGILMNMDDKIDRMRRRP